jgi:prevent-host-death family protein
MIKTLRESKSKLSALVEIASQGEEVVITVRGKPKARLCPLEPKEEKDHKAWAAQLREARARYSTGTHDSSQPIIDRIRSERE